MDIQQFYPIFTKCDGRFTTDTRKIEEGAIFFALKGANFNGNKFALKALELGAHYAVVDEDCGTDERLIRVADVLTFLQDLAHFHRQCFDIPVIAIGGSNGKTTTKNLLYEVLKTQYKTHCTAGNFNNHIGVPITLLQIPTDCEIAIIELGTNNPGEIEALSKLTNPNYGLITNIGKEHLEGFGSLEAVAKEESELYHYLLQTNGFAFVNGDDDWLVRMSRAIENKRVFSSTDVVINHVVPSISFTLNGVVFNSSLMGDYNLENILTAVTIGLHFDIPLPKISESIARYTPDNNRSQIVERESNTIWLDAYNANPSSMQKAIDNFSKLPQSSKVLILGDMFEMGDAAIEEHRELIAFAKPYGFEAIYLLGNHFAEVSEALGITTFGSMEDLGKAIQSASYKETAFLIKGSRGMRMESVLDYI